MNDLPALTRSSLQRGGMPTGMQIMLDKDLYDHCANVAKVLAGSKGFVPPHLENATYACFAVVVQALNWRMDPFTLAACTYQTPGGKVGYEGKLIQGILENSGRFEGSPSFALYGDWDKIKGRIKIKTSSNGKNYPAQDWKPEDEVGLGVEVSWQVKGEVEPRTLRFDLNSAYPRNSTLWASRPDQQIKYTAIRAFANVCAPGILMGVPFVFDEVDSMVDITPGDEKPTRGAVSDALPEDVVQLGREGYAAGRRFREHPDDLTPEQIEHWREGWQSADKEHHDGVAEQDAAVDEAATKNAADAADQTETKRAEATQNDQEPNSKQKQQETQSKPAAPAEDDAGEIPDALRRSPSDTKRNESDGEEVGTTSVEALGEPEQFVEHVISEMLAAAKTRQKDGLSDVYAQYEYQVDQLPQVHRDRVHQVYGEIFDQLDGA